jgi:GNAT superfamily N-acetyltransferase
MKSEVVVRQAGPEEFERVGHLIHALLAELFPDGGYKRDVFVETARTLLTGNEGVWSFLATTHDDRDVGVVTINQCAAISSGGRFGEISELYVVPDYRSKGVGALLIDATVGFCRERGWHSIEVGAPSVPRWQRTVDFYLGHGFEEIGPRLDLQFSESVD